MFPYCFLKFLYSIYKNEKDVDFVQLYIFEVLWVQWFSQNFQIFFFL
jgi:hypothetical protein